jgi:hypothetical protein
LIKKTARWISTILGAILMVISSVSGVYLFITKQAVQRDRELIRSNTMEVKIDKLSISDSIFSTNFNELLSNQKELIRSLNENVKVTRSVNVGFTNHLKSTERLQELLKYYELQKSMDRKYEFKINLK